MCALSSVFKHILYAYREQKLNSVSTNVKKTNKKKKHSLPIEFPALVSLEVLFLKGIRIIWHIVIHHNQQMRYYHRNKYSTH